MKKRSRTFLAILIALLTMLLGSIVAFAAKKYDFDISVDSGYEGKVQVGCYVPFAVTIENTGKDFTGTVQIITKGQDGNIMYEKEVSLAAGATKTVTITIPINSASGKVNVRMVTDHNKVVWSEKAKYNAISSILNVNVGILSDDFGALGYMDGQALLAYPSMQTHIYELDAESMPTDWQGLDMLDVLVITNYSTDLLTDEQVTAIHYWVKKGGLLMVSTGSTASKTLAKLEGTIVEAELGSLSQVKTKFGLTINEYSAYYSYIHDLMLQDSDWTEEEYQAYYDYVEGDSKKEDEAEETEENELLALVNGLSYVEANVLDIQLQNYSSVFYGETEEKGETFMLAQAAEYGEGYVLLAAVDFTQTPLPDYEGSGLMFLNMIEVLIGDSLIEEAESYSSYYYYNNVGDYYAGELFSGLSGAKSPSVLLYSIILLAYVLAFPIIYAVLRKKKKAMYMWAAIPITVFIFCFLIYLAGFTTRLIRTEINVAKVWNLQDGKINESAYAAVTLPNNKGAKLAFSPEYMVEFYYEDDYYYYFDNTEETDLDSYDIGIRTTADAYNVEICNNTALATENIIMEKSFSVEGSLDSDIYYISHQLSGTITNNLGYDLASAVFIINSEAYIIGDIKAGETVALDNLELVGDSANYSSYYSYYMVASNIAKDVLPGRPSELMTLLLGSVGSNYKTYAAKAAVLEYGAKSLLSSYGYSYTNSGTLLAFPDVEETSVQSNGKVNEHSVTLLKSELSVKNSLDGYNYEVYDTYDIGIMNTYNTEVSYYYDENQLLIYNTPFLETQYRFEADTVGIELDFTQTSYYSYFIGNIYFYNYTTETYDLISDLSAYSDNNWIMFEDYSDYVYEGNGKLYVYIAYEPDMNYFGDWEDIVIPTIYMKREE